jgi:hypothetical protein
MSIVINDFSANEDGVSATISSTTPINTAIFTITDGTVESITSELTDNGVGLYTFTKSGDYSDGIFSLEFVNTDLESTYKTIGNLLVGTGCMLKKVLLEQYDCVLFQQLEAIKQLLMSNAGDLSRSMYQNVLYMCTDCAADETLSDEVILEGISIWIVNDDFIVQ